MIGGEELDKSTFLKDSIVIYQKKKGFRFGTDTFLLADFVRLKKGEKFIDLGTGSGVIPLLLLKKYEYAKGAALDVLESCINIAKLNVEINGLIERLDLYCANVKDVRSIFRAETFDVVVSNPPFKEFSRGLLNPNSEKAIAKHEIEGTLEDFIDAASYLLRFKGRLYMVLPVERFIDTVCFCRKRNIEPKVVRFIHPSKSDNANLFLVEAWKGGGKSLKIMPPLCIYEDKKAKVFTKELKERYERFFEDR